MLNSRLISACFHALLIALGFLTFTAARKVEKQSHVEQLIFSADLPVPTVRPIHSMVSGPRLSRPALLSIGVRVATPVEEQQPRLVALSNSATVELPSAPVAQVVEAPQVTVGAFGSPAAGNASSHQGGTVSQAGFGANGDAVRTLHGGARVVAAGFNTTQAPLTVPVATHESIQPPVVSYEASPIYSEAARTEHITGTVVLRVRFTAEGSVKVLQVVQGLGYGLDESAIRTAESIRFTPAVQGGHAVAFDTLARITFQLGVE
jgi:TonB family protein